MTAFVASNGSDNFFDAYTGGSTNATLDSYAISAGSRLIVRTDTYACPNHSAAFGSLDTVTFTGQGGTLRFDPTYVREVSFTGGSGTVPAYGTPITGTISAASIAFYYDYDGNTQAGYAGGTDRNVVLIGIRPGSGKYVAAEGTLTRSKSIALSLVAEADRVYA